MNLKSYLAQKHKVINESKARVWERLSGLSYLLNRAEDEPSKIELMKDMSWLRQELFIEEKTKSEPMYWMMNNDVIEKPNFSELDESKLHLLELVYSTVKEDGPVMDWEIVEKTQKPLFRVQHALQLLYGLTENCPYKRITERCVPATKRYINKKPALSEKEEFENYNLKKKKKTISAEYPSSQPQLP